MSSQTDPFLQAADPSSLSDPSSKSFSSSTSTSPADSSSSGSKPTNNGSSKPGSNSSQAPGTVDPATADPANTAGGATGNTLNSGTTGTTATNPSNAGTNSGTTGSNTGTTGSAGTTNGGHSSTTNGNGNSNMPPLDTNPPSTVPTHTPTTAAPTSTVPTPTSTVPTITASTNTSAIPTPTATHSSSTQSIFTSTASVNPVLVTSTYTPQATSVPTAIPSPPSQSEPSTNLIGPIIGGIAGGLVGLILLTWLILIPIRRRAEQRKEVDWMPFGSDNDHLNNDSGNDSLYRTPRSGVGEIESKPIDSPDMYQMSDIGSNANHTDNMGSLYSHLDRNPSNPSSRPNYSAAAAEGYGVASDVVGDMPAGHYLPGHQPPVYYSHALAAQQQQQMYAGYNNNNYSRNTSPEMAAQRFIGQHDNGGWAQTPSGTSIGHPGATPLLRTQRSFHHSPGQPNTVHLYDPHGLSRNPSGGSNAPAYVSPQHTAAMPAMPIRAMHAQDLKSSRSPDHDEDSQLAYAQDAIGTPRPEHGQVNNLHVVNNGSDR